MSRNKRRLLGSDLDLEVCAVCNAILVYTRNTGRKGGTHCCSASEPAAEVQESTKKKKRCNDEET